MNEQTYPLHETEDEASVDFDAQLGSPFYKTDDEVVDVVLSGKLENLLNTITRVGGEVARLRAEVDGLLEQNAVLIDSFQRLRDTMHEKGALDLEDFELACEVMEAAHAPSPMAPIKKLAN